MSDVKELLFTVAEVKKAVTRASRDAYAKGRADQRADFDALLARIHRLKELNGTGELFAEAWGDAEEEPPALEVLKARAVRKEGEVWQVGGRWYTKKNGKIRTASDPNKAKGPTKKDEAAQKKQQKQADLSRAAAAAEKLAAGGADLTHEDVAHLDAHLKTLAQDKLKDVARQLKQKVGGKKSELADRLVAHARSLVAGGGKPPAEESVDTPPTPETPKAPSEATPETPAPGADAKTPLTPAAPAEESKPEAHAQDWQHKDAGHPVAKAIAADPHANAAAAIAAPHAELGRRHRELRAQEEPLWRKRQEAEKQFGEDSQEFRKADDEWWAKRKELNEAGEELDKANESVRSQLYEHMKTDNPVKINVTKTTGRSWWNPVTLLVRSAEEASTDKRPDLVEISKKSVELGQKGFAKAHAILTGVVESHGADIAVEVGHSSSGRAFQIGIGPLGLFNRTPIIGMGISGDVEEHVDTATHELGHLLEDKIPDIRERAKQFLAYRVGDEPYADFRDVPGGGAMKGEKGRKDTFDRAFNTVQAYYVGKTYGKGDKVTTEVVSMGLEKLHRDPVGFFANDPEYAGFIVSLLRRAKS